MLRITKIILWLVGLGLLNYFIFLPIEIKREKPRKISPQETILPPASQEIQTSTKY